MCALIFLVFGKINLQLSINHCPYCDKHCLCFPSLMYTEIGRASCSLGLVAVIGRSVGTPRHGRGHRPGYRGCYPRGRFEHVCFTAGKCFLNVNMSNAFLLTTASINMICGYGNYDNIDKTVTRFYRMVRFVPKYWNTVKIKCLK